MSKFGVIIVAAGRSTRFSGAYKKPFAPLAGRAVWLHSAERFNNRDDVAQVVVVIAEEDREEFKRKFGANLAILGFDVAIGGKQRADSVASGLAKLGDEVEFVAVHDAARPCITEREIDKLFAKVQKSGAGLLATPVASTLKRATRADKDLVVEATVPRDALWAAQTPQAFRHELLTTAYQQDDLASATDDAQLVERLGHSVSVVEGSPLNIKITTPADLKLAEQILKVAPRPKLDGGRNPLAGDDLFR